MTAATLLSIVVAHFIPDVVAFKQCTARWVLL